MRLDFEDEMVSSAVFATGIALGGNFVVGGRFLREGTGGSEKEIQTAGGQCGAYAQASCQAGWSGHRLFGGLRKRGENSGDKGRVYPERSLQPNAQRLAVRCRETPKVRSLPHRETRAIRC